VAAKFVLIGGGSYGWTHRLVTDIACLRTLHGMHIVLHDINPDTLAITLPLCRKISAALGANLKIESTTDLDAALQGADFVGLTITTAGQEGNRLDHLIPMDYGIFQTVGDTVGPGGWSRALRNIPVVVDIVRRVEQIAPNAWFMNYSNPMTVLTRALLRTSAVKSVGLCHELQGFLLHAATWLGVDWEKDMRVRVAGINHLIWILGLDVRGLNGLELLRQREMSPDAFEPVGELGPPEELLEAGGVNPHHAIKFDFLRRLGIMTGAGDGHTAEFFSHYLRDEASIRRWGFDPTNKAHTFSHTSDYDKRKAVAEDLLSGRQELWLKHSHEHASRIIAALVGAEPGLLTPVNLANTGQIENLPRGAVVETLASVDQLGIHPLCVGPLPAAPAAWTMRHVLVQEMIVEAGLTGNRDLAVQALSCDPLVPDPDTAQKIADDVFEQFRDWLPQFHGKWTP